MTTMNIMINNYRSNFMTKKEYFNDIKNRANVQLFNIKNSQVGTNDIDIIKTALKNLVFYADKQLEKLENKNNKNEKANEKEEK